MNSVIEQMLARYEIKNTNDEVNALKEVIQEIVLSGLSRGGFFDVAAFYGGTALRIFYNLNRFSEDLDFALMFPDENFDLSKYFSYIEKELKAYGLNLEVNTKKKSVDSNITSAFVKGDTLEHILKFFPNEVDHKYNRMLKDIKIKFEVDVLPPAGATYEEEYKLLPSPHRIRLYDKGSLFAGKIHAILCRNWKSITKGRDLYDYVFFMGSDTGVNMELIRNKLVASNVISESDKFDIEVLRELLISKFREIDCNKSREDVIPFIRNVSELDIWSEEFFVSITKKLRPSV